MGIVRSDWVVVGVDIGMDYYDDENYERFDQYSERCKIGEITYLIDGMSGEYFIVGEVVLHADDYKGFGVNDFPLIDMSEFKDSVGRVSTFIKENFEMEEYPEPRLMILTHLT